MKRLDYYFWINSDWAYLGADRLEEIARRHGAVIHYKPVDLLDVYARSGGIPLSQRSASRQAYREAELRRWIRRLSIPLNITPRYMCPNGDLAACVVIAADQSGLDVALLYKSILKAEWVEDRDISDSSVLQLVLKALAMPARSLLQGARDPHTVATYRRYTDEAVEAGVFGSPCYVFEGELFWGQDRLSFLDEALAAA